MTLEEAKALAKEVGEGKSRSYVQAAQALATFVSSLPTPPSLDGKVIGTLEGPCKLVPVAEYTLLRTIAEASDRWSLVKASPVDLWQALEEWRKVRTFSLTCKACGAKSPVVKDEDEVADAAVDAGWRVEGNNEDDRDLCPPCST